jgi:hypothetical protein
MVEIDSDHVVVQLSLVLGVMHLLAGYRSPLERRWEYGWLIREVVLSVWVCWDWRPCARQIQVSLQPFLWLFGLSSFEDDGIIYHLLNLGPLHIRWGGRPAERERDREWAFA